MFHVELIYLKINNIPINEEEKRLASPAPPADDMFRICTAVPQCWSTNALSLNPILTGARGAAQAAKQKKRAVATNVVAALGILHRLI